MPFDPRIYTSSGLNSTVVAKLPNGNVASGSVDWLTTSSLQVELDQTLKHQARYDNWNPGSNFDHKGIQH